MTNQLNAAALRELIKAAPDIRSEEVTVEEWGITVLVKGMSGRQRDAFEASMMDRAGKGKPKLVLDDIRAKLVVRSVYTTDGKEPVFTDADVLWLTHKSAAALQKLFNVAQRLSGVTDDDVEELAKNSSSETNGASGSTSQPS